MVKQAAIQTCICGQAVVFPEGEIKTVCKTKGCGAVWELGAEGFWRISNFLIGIFAEIIAGKQAKPNHYEKYMAKRKAVRR